MPVTPAAASKNSKKNDEIFKYNWIMKKKVILCLFAVTLVVMACAQQLIQQSGQELMQHPWQGKRVAYFGD